MCSKDGAERLNYSVAGPRSAGKGHPLKGHLFIAPGDITQLNAHAVAYSASDTLDCDGNLYSAFAAHVPGFAEWFDHLREQHPEPCRVGDAFWMPLDTGQKPLGVVAVVSIGESATHEDKAGIAVRSALTTAIRQLRAARRKDERLLIALPTFRVGKGGDDQERLRSARAQIAAAAKFLAENDGVDVAFIPYTVPLYQIFLRARREELGEPDPDASHYPDLEQALRARECVIFVGAGLSSGAGLPDWNSQVRRLSDDHGIRWDARRD
jgi:hypothetical protein